MSEDRETRKQHFEQSSGIVQCPYCCQLFDAHIAAVNDPERSAVRRERMRGERK